MKTGTLHSEPAAAPVGPPSDSADQCDPYTVRQAILSVPNAELVVLPAAAEDCYRIGWGLYATESEAHAAQPAIADRLRQLGVNFDGRVQRVVASLR